MSTTIILTLAHLLHQHSPDYESSKNSLLDTTATLAMELTSSSTSEVHMVLTGSPRPTFAETNAWLLKHGKKNRNRSNTADSTSSCDSSSNSSGMSTAEEDEADLQSYLYESTDDKTTTNANMNDLCGSPTKIGGSVLSHFRNQRKNSVGGREGDVGAGNINSSGDNKDAQHATPLVGQAVVNSIAQTKGVGLHSSRAKLLQGTIDRPLWDQRRWTDGECLFSDLIDRCGLESFASNNKSNTSTAIGDGDSAAGNTNMGKLVSNLSAHLITVSPQVIVPPTNNNDKGMEQETVNEIARSILRFLKRKNSEPASKVYLIVSEEEGEEKKNVMRDQLIEAWKKLEMYNDLIGAVKLLDGVLFEFVDA